MTTARRRARTVARSVPEWPKPTGLRAAAHPPPTLKTCYVTTERGGRRLRFDVSSVDQGSAQGCPAQACTAGSRADQQRHREPGGASNQIRAGRTARRARSSSSLRGSARNGTRGREGSARRPACLLHGGSDRRRISRSGASRRFQRLSRSGILTCTMERICGAVQTFIRQWSRARQTW